tara:strand:+ start:873 stop:1223 length:351 start_codon:yes stop_codon:yes gene_type:complete
MLLNKIILTTCFLVFLSGCSESSSEVKPTYKSADLYKNKTCLELNNELSYLEIEVQKMATLVDTSQSDHVAKLSLGWLIWPSYAFIDNNESEAHKLSLLRGEYDAILRSLKSKQCV